MFVFTGSSIGFCYRSRLFSLLVAVAFILISSCQSTESPFAIEETTVGQSQNLSFVKYVDLTDEQKRAIVTVELNAKNASGIDQNRKALDAIYRNIRTAIVEYLSRKRSTPFTKPSPSTTTPTTTAATTAATPADTTAATTAAAATTTTLSLSPIFTIIVTLPPRPIEPGSNRKKRKVKRETYLAENDISFVYIEPTTQNGILYVSLFINKQGIPDPSELLHSALTALRDEGTLQEKAELPIVAIYKDLPQRKLLPSVVSDVPGAVFSSAPVTENHIAVWLPALLVVLVVIALLVIFIVVYWKRKKTGTISVNRQSRGQESEK